MKKLLQAFLASKLSLLEEVVAMQRAYDRLSWRYMFLVDYREVELGSDGLAQFTHVMLSEEEIKEIAEQEKTKIKKERP